MEYDDSPFHNAYDDLLNKTKLEIETIEANEMKDQFLRFNYFDRL